MKYGLSAEVRARLQTVFAQHPAIDKVIIYGSRAKGSYHEGSDIDLTLVGDKLALSDLYAIDEDLDQLDLAYTLDLSLYGQIDNQGLIEHIERWGEVFYKGTEKAGAWKLKRLVDISTIKGGKRIPKGNKLETKNTGYPYIRVSDFNDKGSVDINNIRFISKEIFQKIKNYTITSNDLYISIAGTIGKAGIIPDELSGANLTENACKLTFDDEINNKYAYYFTQTLSFLEQADLNTRVAAMPKLALSRLGSIVLPVCSITEQKRIVAILDQTFTEIEKARANAEQNLKNARELFESTLQQVFNQGDLEWVEISLGNILNVKHGFAFKSEFFVEVAQYTLLTPGNFYEKGGYRDRGEKQKYYAGDIPEDFILTKGSLLVAMTEQAKGLLGSPALIPEDNQFLHNQRLGLIQLNEDYKDSVHLAFLFYFFNTKNFRGKVQETATGLKVRHTSPKKIMAINISLPTDINIQKVIASKLDSIKKQTAFLEDIYEKKIIELDELKKSILQKAFTGKLTNEFSI